MTPLLYAPTIAATYAWHVRSARIHRATAHRLGPSMACYAMELQDAIWHVQQARKLREAAQQIDQWAGGASCEG